MVFPGRTRILPRLGTVICAAFLLTVQNSGGLIVSEEESRSLSFPKGGRIGVQPDAGRTNRADAAPGTAAGGGADYAGMVVAEPDGRYFTVALILFAVISLTFLLPLILGWRRRRQARLLTRRKARESHPLTGVVSVPAPLQRVPPELQARGPSIFQAADDPRVLAEQPLPVMRRVAPQEGPASPAPAKPPFCRVVSPLSDKIR